VSPAEHARAVARSILAAGRFHQPPVPRPFAGVLHWLGGAADSITNAIGRFASSAPLALAALAALVVIGLALVARGAIGRRGRRSARVAVSGARGAPGARELEAAAARAESAGDYAAAVRLRFRAGIARLAERGALRSPATMRGGEIGMRLRSPAFDELNETFEAVAYGGRSAAEDDARRARAGWERIVEEVRS
jgi:hypothetical protein